MSARKKARKRALDILYAADIRNISLNESLAAEANRALTQPSREASWNYAKKIIEGIAEHGYEIDELIETYSVDWPLERMPTIDRALLRIGIWEILYNDEIPSAVAISEAVSAAQSLSTEDSSRFINGILARISELQH